MAQNLASLQDQINESWDIPHEDDDNNNHGIDVSSLALNLSNQAEYNNELLSYVKELEIKYQQMDRSRYELLGQIETISQNSAEANERADDLYRKLKLSSNLCDELTSQLQTMREEASQYETIARESKVSVETIRQQNIYLEESNRNYNIRVNQLESELDDMRRFKKTLVEDDTLDETNRLTFTLEANQAELERARKNNYELQLLVTMTKDENFQLQRRVEHLIKQYEDDLASREKLQSKNREMSDRLSALQDEVADLLARNDQLSESLNVSVVRVKQSQSIRDEAVERSQITDLRWRELEVRYMFVRSG
jgi:hypothetical protein